jgi:hypothetical protein
VAGKSERGLPLKATFRALDALKVAIRAWDALKVAIRASRLGRFRAPVTDMPAGGRGTTR